MKDETKVGIIKGVIAGVLFLMCILAIIWIYEEANKYQKFCESKGYESVDEGRIKEDIQYVKCCDIIIQESDFKEECKIFRFKEQKK